MKIGSRFFLLAAVAFGFPAHAANAPKPIEALLITGGGYHDYEHQQHILTEGISARANVHWTIFYENGDTMHELSIYNRPGFANGYDVIVHNECYADVSVRAEYYFFSLIVDRIGYGRAMAFACTWPQLSSPSRRRVTPRVGMISVGVLGGPFLGTLQDVSLDKNLREARPTIHAAVAMPPQDKFGLHFQPLDKAKIAALSDRDQAVVGQVISSSNQHVLAEIAILPAIMLLCYLGLGLYFRRHGGYHQVELASPQRAR